MLFTPRNTPGMDRLIGVDVGPGEVRQSYDLTLGRVLMVFGLQDVMSFGSRVTEATLTLPVLGPPGQPGELGISNVLRPWDPDTVSWSTPWSAPGGVEGVDFSTVRAISVIAGGPGEIVEGRFDVTEEMKRWVTCRASNVGWMIVGDMRIGGRTAALMAATPRLDVKYSEGAAAVRDAGFSRFGGL